MSGRGFRRHGGFRRKSLSSRHYPGRYGPKIACHPGYVDCPERETKVHFRECLECENFKVWHEKDQGLKRCWHEYKDLESRGRYDGTWDDHPENFDPETFTRLQEKKHINEEVNREMELERAELDRKAEELLQDPTYYYGDLWKMDEGEEEDEDDDEEEYP